MPNFSGSASDIVNRQIAALTSSTNITQLAPGGKARTIIEAASKELERSLQVQDLNIQKAFLPTTFGQFLDYLGTTLGVKKFTETNASALAIDRCFRFYTRYGDTFGSINGGSSFTVPKGTIISAPATVAAELQGYYGNLSDPESTYDRSIHYQLTEDVVCSSSAKEVFFSAQALAAGRIGNLATGKMIKSHNFTTYSDYAANSLLATNDKSVLNGADPESEASYKYRISKKLIAAQKANYTSILQAALAVPGVADAVVIPFDDGPGRFTVYVKTISSVASDQTIRDVQDQIYYAQAQGVTGVASKPYEVGLEISSTLKYKENYTTQVKSIIKQGVSLAITRYVNSLDLGQPLQFSSLADEVMRSDPRIISVGTHPTTVFDGTFIYYPSKISSTLGRRRERFMKDVIVVPLHARIIMETTISSPVTLE